MNLGINNKSKINRYGYEVTRQNHIETKLGEYIFDITLMSKNFEIFSVINCIMKIYIQTIVFFIILKDMFL